MKPRLRIDTLYFGDNGRCFCGRIGCAGASAHFTARDLSGQRVQVVTASEIREYGFRCESCGMQPKTGEPA